MSERIERERERMMEGLQILCFCFITVYRMTMESKFRATLSIGLKSQAILTKTQFAKIALYLVISGWIRLNILIESNPKSNEVKDVFM